MNTFDWLSALDIQDPDGTDLVEVSFKNGSRKDFFHNPPFARANTGDMVLVECEGGGYDIGRVSLSGELVKMQLKKKGVRENTVFADIIRKANERDLDRLQEARELEKPTMIQARVIARALDVDMKVGDVEYQADKRKATFFYTADGRVDFRELIRQYAKDFKVKIEMRQIGARQESSRIGGLGTCGRELCCSTWLSDFRSVSTTAARYQNLAINQSKLSGQCGRLKCCLNYELDAYAEALETFPTGVDRLETAEGNIVLMKTDIFKGLMFYAYEKNRGQFYAIRKEKVKEIKEMNKKGQKPADLASLQVAIERFVGVEGENDIDENVGFEENLTGIIELPMDAKKKKKRGNDSRESNRGGENPFKDDRRNDRKPENRNNTREKEARPPREARSKDEPNQGNNTRPAREPRNNDNPRPPREPREGQAPRNNSEAGNPKQRDNNNPRPPREPQPPRDNTNNNRPPREPRNANEPREPRPPREPQTPRPPREPREPQAPRENVNNNRPPREPQAPRENNNQNRPPREPRPVNTNEPREPRNDNNKNNNQNRPPREPRHNNNPRPPREPNTDNVKKEKVNRPFENLTRDTNKKDSDKGE
jgi:cell fate regulator YaaT (PSP1 superfamily)